MNPCGKKWYFSLEEAMVEVRRLQAWPEARAPHLLSAYECARCEGYHVGHNRKLTERPISLCEGEMK